MTLRTLTTIVLAAGLLTASGAFAQQQPAAPPNLDAVPDKMPFATPYGAPITMERAQAAIQAAAAEANKRGWALNITVVDPNGDLVAFGRMHGNSLQSPFRNTRRGPPRGTDARPMHSRTALQKPV